MDDKLTRLIDSLEHSLLSQFMVFVIAPIYREYYVSNDQVSDASRDLLSLNANIGATRRHIIVTGIEKRSRKKHFQKIDKRNTYRTLRQNSLDRLSR